MSAGDSGCRRRRSRSSPAACPRRAGRRRSHGTREPRARGPRFHSVKPLAAIRRRHRRGRRAAHGCAPRSVSWACSAVSPWSCSARPASRSRWWVPERCSCWSAWCSLGPAWPVRRARCSALPPPRFAVRRGHWLGATRCATRARRRAAATALLVGVAVVTVFTVLGASIKASIGDVVRSDFHGDLVIVNNEQSGSGMDPSLVGRLERVPEVGAATGFGIARAAVDGSQEIGDRGRRDHARPSDRPPRGTRRAGRRRCRRRGRLLEVRRRTPRRAGRRRAGRVW